MTTTPIVNTHEGKVQGVAENGVFVFKGIPYAQPPIGELRWRVPQPIAPWRDVRMADRYGASSWQDREACMAGGGGDPAPLDEDCLYLNVWTPSPTPAASGGLPVMFWIHGGAYIIGAGHLPPYIGSPLATRGAVVVTFNYRLGQLGFFAHSALRQDHPEVVANFGLADQIAALRWVQRNIANFGGDPKNVTLFGQSAGGKSVLALTASPLARDLFQRGIVESAYALQEATLEEASERAARVATAMGLPGDRAGAGLLRGLPAKRLWNHFGPELSNAPVAIAGDSILPKTILQIFKDKTEAQVPLILGSTSDDASVMKDMGIDQLEVLEELRRRGVAVGPLYPDIKDDDVELARQVCRDLLFTCTPLRFANHHGTRPMAWRYYFDYVAEQLRADYPHGTPHGFEVSYPFGTLDMTPPTQGMLTEMDRELSRHCMDYWFQFASTGMPSAAGCPTWDPHKPPAKPLQNRTMVLQEQITASSDFMRDRLNLLILAGEFPAGGITTESGE